MPRYTRKTKSRKAKTYRKKQKGGSEESNVFQNVLGITSAVGYNKEALIPGLQLSKRTASNYLTQLMYKRAHRNYEEGLLDRDIYELWDENPSMIQSKLKAFPILRTISLQNAKRILREFNNDLQSIQSTIEEREFDLRYGTSRDARYIIKSDIEDFREIYADKYRQLQYFEEFLRKERPGYLETVNLNSNNNNIHNNENNNYGNAMRRMYGNNAN